MMKQVRESMGTKNGSKQKDETYSQPSSTRSLDLETSRLPSSSTLLELPSLGSDERLLVLVWAHTKVSYRFSSILGSSEENSVATLGRSKSELVQGQTLSTSSDDALSSSLGESQGGNGELGEFLNSDVIGDGSNDDDGLGWRRTSWDTTAVLGEVDQSRDRDGGLVDLAHEQSSEDDLVESRVGSSSQESVEL